MAGSRRQQGLNSVGGGTWRGQLAHQNAMDGERDTARTVRVMNAIHSQQVHNEGKAAKPFLGPIAIRPMQIDDASYVIDSWSNSYRRSPTTGPIDREVFNIEQRARIDRLVTRAAARVFIACDAVDKRQIRGWICFEAPFLEGKVPIVHYVCVQPIYQLNGIGNALIKLARQTHTDADPTAPMWCTHETAPMRHVRPKWGLIYNPYLLEVTQDVAAKRDVRRTEGTTNYGL